MKMSIQSSYILLINIMHLAFGKGNDCQVFEDISHSSTGLVEHLVSLSCGILQIYFHFGKVCEPWCSNMPSFAQLQLWLRNIQQWNRIYRHIARKVLFLNPTFISYPECTVGTCYTGNPQNNHDKPKGPD